MSNKSKIIKITKNKLVKTLKTNTELWNRYKKYYVNSYIDLSRANLSRIDLRGADLSKADLSRANLSRADLRGVNLSKADLNNANLSRANLRGADLSKADLNNANLSSADLHGADLREANLRGANLDFTALPLWCGSFNMLVDKNLTEQLLLHIYKLHSSHSDFNKIKEFIEPYIKNCATVAEHKIKLD